MKGNLFQVTQPAFICLRLTIETLEHGVKYVQSRCQISLHKRWSFTLRISSVNVTKSAGNCGFGHIYRRNFLWKTSFFVQCMFRNTFDYMWNIWKLCMKTCWNPFNCFFSEDNKNGFQKWILQSSLQKYIQDPIWKCFENAKKTFKELYEKLNA